jgi:integrase
MKGTLRATVKVAGRQRERRFVEGTPKRVIASWKERTEAALKKRYPAQTFRRTQAGTVAADIERTLPLRKGMTSWTDYCALLRSWGACIGTKNRAAIEKADVLLARAGWIEAGQAARTINNRVSALRTMYKLLDGDDAPTPCDGIKPLKLPPAAKQLVPLHIVNRVCAKLLERHEQYQGARTRRGRPGGQHALKDRARLMVMSACGKRPAEVGRAEPDDFDWDRRVWYDRAAKAGESPGVYLNDEMLLAWQEFIEADAWGDFEQDGHFARRLRDAGWPKGLKPYNVRHSAWTDASERGADLADIQVGAGHRRIETTRKHYVPVLNSRMQRLSEMIDKRHGWTPRVMRGKESA